jgi:UDP-galactopyranose mutase
MYDYLVVGAGLFGATFAHEMTKRGKTCVVVDKRNHIGGNCYTENVHGITVHKYGPHIFHTNKKCIWEYVNQFAEFNRFTNCPMAQHHGKLYNMPFNMNTFYQLWGVKTPLEAKEKIDSQRVICHNPRNLEEKALDMVGKDIYEILVKEYTEKQWGRKCTELSPDIISRLPLRFTFDNSYFNDRYQGIPIDGYTPIFEQLLADSWVILDVDFLAQREYLMHEAKQVIYTGMADELFDYKYGRLPYRSLEFREQEYDCPNYQGNAVVNYTGHEVQYTRAIEHKHFDGAESPVTIVTREYSKEFTEGCIPYYPVNNSESAKLYAMYAEEARKNNIILGGRIGMYRYFDMDETIRQAILLANSLSV